MMKNIVLIEWFDKKSGEIIDSKILPDILPEILMDILDINPQDNLVDPEMYDEYDIFEKSVKRLKKYTSLQFNFDEADYCISRRGDT